MPISPLTFKEIEQMLDAYEEAARNATPAGSVLAERALQASRDTIWAELDRVRRVQDLLLWALSQDDPGPFPALDDPTPVLGWVTLVEGALDGTELGA